MKKQRFLLMAIMLLMAGCAIAQNDSKPKSFAESIALPADNIRVSRRPPVGERLFSSETIEKKIKEVTKLLKEAPYLAWMFENCFPNTLDTTVHYSVAENGDDDVLWPL